MASVLGHVGLAPLILRTSATPALSLSCPKAPSCLDLRAFAQALRWPRIPLSVTVSSSDLRVTSYPLPGRPSLPSSSPHPSSSELLCQGLRMLTPQYGKHHEAETTHSGAVLFGSPACARASHSSWYRGPVKNTCGPSGLWAKSAF